jgi:hypothetical protein
MAFLSAGEDTIAISTTAAGGLDFGEGSVMR